MEDLKKLSRLQKSAALDVVDAMRWDHVWLYGLIERCRQLQQIQRRRDNG